MTRCSLVLITVLLLMGCSRESAGARADTSGNTGATLDNIARDRPYVFTTRPSYRLCTDEDDRIQLTDGKTHGSDWKDKSTVGWAREDSPPGVIIDLGKVEPIGAVRVHSIGGGSANVFFPNYILVFVSDDGDNFHFVATQDSGHLEQNRVDSRVARATSHTFVLEGLQTRGRYVLVMFEPDGSYVFTDEIEVFRGSHDPDKSTFHAADRVTADSARSMLAAAREYAFIRSGIHSLERLPGGGNAAGREAVNELRHALSSIAPHDTRSLERLAERVGRVRAKRLRVHMQHPLHWEPSNPMHQARPFDLPAHISDGDDAERRLTVDMWRGEYESAAITLFNTSDEPLRTRASLTPLRRQDGSMLASDRTVQLRTPVFVDARSKGRIGDALIKPPQGGFEIPPGRAGQLWLTIHNAELEPGRYDFAIDVAHQPVGSEADPTHEMIQASITVHPIHFPATPTLKTNVWAYLERSELTQDHERLARADLRAHYVNVDTFFWGSTLPMPRLRPDGSVEIERERAIAALRRYTGSDLKLFYWGLGKHRLNVPRMPPIMSPEWQQAMRDWLTQWIELLKEHGLDYDDFAMYPFDEMLPREFYQIARFIKEFDPRIRIFANSRGDSRGVEMERIAPYIDIWCFRDATFTARMSPVERRIRESGAEVWSYECARPAKGKPPHGYYRLQAWRAFARGDAGAGFWIYTDPGDGNGNAWDDFASSHGRYGVIYGPIGSPDGVDLSDEPIIPSRRWEAWREGVEDYEYLVTLRQAIKTARETDKQARADRAQAILDRTVRDVLENPNNPDLVYRAREEITRQILSLRAP